MPVEIRELHIRVAVSAKPAQQPQGARGPSGKDGEGGADKDAIVAECVEQVLQILQAKKER